MSKPCFVYIITPDGSAGPCKVGISDDPGKRVAALATGSPVPLVVSEVYAFDSRQRAQAMERQFHDSYANWRLHGEWFDIDFDDANFWLFENTVAVEAFDTFSYGNTPR